MATREGAPKTEDIKIEEISNIPIARRYPPEATQNLKTVAELDKNSVLKQPGKHGIGRGFNAPTISIPFSTSTNVHMLTVLPVNERRKIEQQQEWITGNKYIKIKNYQRLMMERRGYDITPEPWNYDDDQGMDLMKDYNKFIELMNKNKKNDTKHNDLSSTYTNRTSMLDFIYTRVDPIDGNTKTCAVFYVFPEKNSKLTTDPKKVQSAQVLSKGLKPIMLIVNKIEPDEMILIVSGNIKTSYIEALVSSKLLKKTKTVVFNEKNFMFDVTDHILQPIRSKRIIPVNVNDEESVADSNMLKERKIDLNKLPSVPFNDPYMKYYGYSTGDIIKLEERTDFLNLISDSLIYYVKIGAYRDFDKK